MTPSYVLSDGVTPQSAVAIGTATGGITATVSPRISAWSPPSLTGGTDKTPVATEVYAAEIHVRANTTLTGLEILIGSVGGTDKFFGILWNSLGAVVANSATAGVTVGTTATYQRLPFTAPYSAVGPGQYFVGVGVNGNTARLMTIPVGPTLATTKQTSQTFGTATALTPPTTFTADVGPVAGTY